MSASLDYATEYSPGCARDELFARLLRECERWGDASAEDAKLPWRSIARDTQLAPEGNWRVWLLRAGRGFGKTRAGAEWVREQVEQHGARRVALVARTAADARDVIVEGESGILAVCPSWSRPKYEPTKRRLTWPNGAIAVTYSSEEPDQLRGPQHDAAYCDEVATWLRPLAWDNLMLGLRLGQDPRCVVTTTPRPTELLRRIRGSPDTAETVGTTYENLANLAPAFAAQIITRYEGTRLGRQELMAEILEDNPGALWQRAKLDEARLTRVPEGVTLRRIVVGVDPAATSGEESAETGILVAGLGTDGHGYVLEDCTLRGTPDHWGRAAVTAYYRHRADRIVAEVNQGGEMVEAVIRTVDSRASYKGVHASRGKMARAEPVAALFEQGKVHLVGLFPELEDQLCSWVPGDVSPDRLDALVWALSELMLLSSGGYVPAFAAGRERPGF